MKHGNYILFYSDDMVDILPFVNTSGLKMNTIILVLQVKIHVQKTEMLAKVYKSTSYKYGILQAC